jgi:glycosyltransferase involved in cell wall biosynthesis
MMVMSNLSQSKEFSLAKTMKVALLFRARGLFFSIEQLFALIAEAMPAGVRTTVEVAPRGGASLRALCVNLLWATRLRGADVLHITGDIHYAALSFRQKPLVLTLLDLRFYEESTGWKKAIFWLFWIYLPCLRASRITVISHFTRDRLLKACSISASRVRVIPCCVAPHLIRKDRDWPLGRPRLLQIGTTSNKNLGRVVEACAGLDVHLIVVGHLTELDRHLLSSSGTQWEAYQDLMPHQVADLYAASDLIIFVSTYEGFGLPILEAQAVGRPVITSNISPMSEVAGEGALKVDPFNVDSIRNGLLRLLAHPELRNELVEKGFENVKQYSATAIAAQYAEVYREALGKS